MPDNAKAEIKFQGEANVFYTSDVSVFSASRRLSLREDPTQPILESTGAGDSIVYEPAAKIAKNFDPLWGKIKVEIRSQGFLYTSHPAFNHGTYGAQVTQALPADFNLIFRYHFGPDQLVGKNFLRRETVTDQISGGEEELVSRNLVSEKVTTHFGTTELEHKLSESYVLRVLGRYGNRSYNSNFSQRNTDFWTIGSHLEWKISSSADMILGYHFERGLAKGRNLPLLGDDVSYRTHYVAADLNLHIMPKLSLILGYDFEHTFYTTNNILDHKHNGHEVIHQGDISLRYKLFRALHLNAGYQHAQRKFSYEELWVVLNTVQVGSIFRF